MRTSVGSHKVAALDHLVAGLAGDDQETRRRYTGVEHRDEIGSKRGNGRVYEDRKLTLSALVPSVHPGKVEVAGNGGEDPPRWSEKNESIPSTGATLACVLGLEGRGRPGGASGHLNGARGGFNRRRSPEYRDLGFRLARENRGREGGSKGEVERG